MGRVDAMTAWAYDYRLKRGAPNLPTNDDFAFYFENIQPAVAQNICHVSGGFSYRFDLGATNDAWFTMNQPNFGVAEYTEINGGFYKSWNSAGGCAADGTPDFDGIVNRVIFSRVSNNTVDDIRVAPGNTLLGPLLGQFFTENINFTLNESTGQKRNNQQVIGTPTNVGINGTCFIARGPLTGSQLQAIFDAA